MKTIFCTHKVGEKWLHDLRSGKFRQGRRTLEANGKYCCLGVLEYGIDGHVECEHDGLPACYPSFNWLERHNINFKWTTRDGCAITSHVAITPFLKHNGVWASAAELNDQGVDFLTIADAIEAAMEFTD